MDTFEAIVIVTAFVATVTIVTIMLWPGSDVKIARYEDTLAAASNADSCYIHSNGLFGKMTIYCFFDNYTKKCEMSRKLTDPFAYNCVENELR